MNSIQAQTRVLLFVLITFFCLDSLVVAADIVAGKEKATICLQCHGAKGNSNNPQYPSLAGQRALYIEAQLKNFQTGQRENPVMQGMVSKLTQQDIKNIAAYFSSLTPESAGDKTLSSDKKGQTKIAMCTGCHGSSAKGRGGFPRLAGQQPDYLERQLLSFKNRSRKGGPMNAIAASLSEQDIKEIAAYLGSL